MGVVTDTRTGATAKGFWRGTHRTVAPEVTLARLEPLLGALGITRVGMLTGLDGIGLPVAQATRPNGRAVSVSLGKGATVAAAKVSAVMEAAESFHAETVTGPLRWAAADDLPGCVDPAQLPASPSAEPPERLRTARCLWIAGCDLIGGATRWVPYQLVHADYTVQHAEPPRFQATTSGLAAGNLVVEAQLHALYEVVERDAVACWRGIGGPGQRAARPIELGSVRHDDIIPLLDRLRTAGVQAAAWDVTSDLGLPAFVVLLVPGGGEPGGLEAELGSGCHLDPHVALSRALTEAAQTRLARIAGARDDFDPGSYGAEARRRRRVEARDWLALGRRRPSTWRATLDGFTRMPSDDLEQDLANALGALNGAGLDEAVWIDLAQPELGLPVGRIVVPGLEGPWQPGRSRPGARAGALRR